MLLSERYLRHRYRKGYEEGLAEGRKLGKEFAKGLDLGREEGLSVGLAAGQKRMEKWARQLIEDGLLPPDIEIPPPIKMPSLPRGGKKGDE